MQDRTTARIMRYRCARDTAGDFDKIKRLEDLARETMRDTPAKRAAREATDADALREAKQALPMWYTGGTCLGDHCAANCSPAGIVSIDLDGIAEDRQGELKARLSAIPCIFFAARSASGRGLYALASVSVGVQTDESRVLALYALIDAVVLGTDRRDGEHLDTACRDIARRRFESYDPAPYYTDAEREYTGNAVADCEAAYGRSAVASLARLFGGRGDCGPGSAQAGLALSAIAVSAGGRVSGRLYTRNFYPARSQVVILGDSGDGKSTGAFALRKAANAVGARPVSAESDRALEAALVESGLEKIADADGNDEWRQLSPPIPLLSICDEAGDEQASRRAREYKSKMNAIRRRAYDPLFHASASLSTKLPQREFRCSYTEVQLTTPKRWADALRGTDRTSGDRRRVLEFWAEGIPEVAGALSPTLARAAAMGASLPLEADADAIAMLMRDLRDALPVANADGESAWLDGLDTLSAFDMLELVTVIPEDIRTNDAIQDTRTMACGLATLAAYAARHDRIEADDIRTAFAIVAAVFANRARLAEIAEVGCVSMESEISGEILEYIGERRIRVSSVRRMLARRGDTYVRAYDALVRAGALIVDRGKSPTVRQATPEEAEAAAAREPERRRDDGGSVWDGQTTATTAPRPKGEAKPYADCDAIEKRARLAAYRERFEIDKPITPGQCDNHLRALRFQLERAGMWDGEAESWLREVCADVGHTSKKDQDRICRPIRGAVKSDT